METRQNIRVTQSQRLQLNLGLQASIRVLKADAEGLTRFLEEQAAENPHLRLAAPPEPAAPAAGQALVRVHRIGICGTDFSGYLGKMPFIEFPRILGHELGVEVLAVGHRQPAWVDTAVDEYLKRIRSPWRVELVAIEAVARSASGKAEATTKVGVQINLQASTTADGSTTAYVVNTTVPPMVTSPTMTS